MRLVAGLVVALLAAVSSQAPLHSAEKEKLPDYYPLKAGTKWHFRVIRGDQQAGMLVNRIAKIEKIDGELLARLETTIDGKVTSTEHLSTSAKGIFRHRYNGVEVSPALCLLKYPAKKGETWKTDIKVGEEKGKATCLVGAEDIEVPAGKYKTITVKVDAEVGEAKLSTTYWFAGGVGFVKQTLDVNGQNVAILELEKFEPGK